MKKKIICILVCTLLIATALPVVGTMNDIDKTFTNNGNLQITLYKGLLPLKENGIEADAILITGEGVTITLDDFDGFDYNYEINLPAGTYDVKVTVGSQTRMKTISLSEGEYGRISFFFPFKGTSSIDTIPSSIKDSTEDSCFLNVFLYKGALPIRSRAIKADSSITVVNKDKEGKSYTLDEADWQDYNKCYSAWIDPGTYTITIKAGSQTRTKTDLSLTDKFEDVNFYFLFKGTSSIDTIPSSIKDSTDLNSVFGLDDNLITNPSFEEGSGGLPTGWIYNDIQFDEEYTWDDSDAYSGSKSVGITHVTEVGDPEIHEISPYYWITQEYIPVDCENNVYVIGGYSKMSKTSDFAIWADLGFITYDENKEYVEKGGYGYGEPGWHYYEFNTGTFGETTHKYIRITLHYDFDERVLDDPTLEIRFDDIFLIEFENSPPTTPVINGPITGKAGEEQTYTITSTDENNDELLFRIDWGDGNDTSIGWYDSGEEVIVSYIWETEGTFILKVQSVDEWRGESEWATLEVTMPRNRAIQTPFLRFLESHPILYQLLQRALQL